MKLKTLVAALAAHAALTSAAFALDPALPAYQPIGSLSGELKSVGSDTLNQQMELWAAGFKAIYPGVRIEPGFAGWAPVWMQLSPNLPPLTRPSCDQDRRRSAGSQTTGQRRCSDNGYGRIALHADAPLPWFGSNS